MKGYGQFCPVAKGAEVFNERWTPLIIRELMCGSHRFNELKRGNPLMSPSLLSQRLKFLEEAGVIEKKAAGRGEASEYYLTTAGEDLGQLVVQLGQWGDKWARSRLGEEDYDPNLLMWDIRRRIDAKKFEHGKTVINFQFMDMQPKKRSWWLVIENDEVDLCLKNPGFDVDLEFRTTAKTMAQVWQGHTSIKQALREGKLAINGSSELRKTLNQWFGFSVFHNTETLAG